MTHRSQLRGSQAPDPQRARKGVFRAIAVWTPVFAVCTALALFLLLEALQPGNGGAWFGFSLLALIGLLSGYSALSAWRDWFSEPMESSAQIVRKWRKSDFLFFFRAHYVLVDAIGQKRVLRVRPDIYQEMPESEGWVWLEHYPHTNALVAWRPLGQHERPAEARQAETEAEQRSLRRRLEQMEEPNPEPVEAVDLPEFGRRADRPADRSEDR